MKTPALVAVDLPAEALAPVFAAARERSVRVGWLELGAQVAPPPTLAAAAALGAARAVAAGDERTVTVKPRRGAAVLRDLLREHFVGCDIVFVRGHEGRPRLDTDGDSFRLELDRGRSRTLGAEALLAELLRPRHRA